MKIKKKGLFQMPTDVFEDDLNNLKAFITFWNSKWDWDSNIPLNKQGKAMRTYLVKRNILSEDQASIIYPGCSTNQSRKNYLNDKVSVAIREFSIKGKEVVDDKIFDAFNAIQYWGAITGRTFYVRSGLTEFNLERFRRNWIENIKPLYLSILMELNSKNADLSRIISFFDKIDGLGVSFGTKHLHFYSKALGWDNSLPIYDTNIFQLLRAEVRKNRYPTWNQYIEVVDEFNKLAAKINISSADVERAFFAYHSKVGIKNSNRVPKEYTNHDHTVVVNDFLNKRLAL